MIRGASVIALLCALCCFTSCVVFHDCGSEWGNFMEVSVSGCQVSDDRCALVRGTNSTIFVKFKPKACVSYLNVNAEGIKNNVFIPYHLYTTPFDLYQIELCHDDSYSKLQCPLCTDKEHNFNVTMFVQTQFPKDFTDIVVQWDFKDQLDRMVLCIQFPAQVKNKATRRFRKIFRKRYLP